MTNPISEAALIWLTVIASLLALARVVCWIWAAEFLARVQWALPEQRWFTVEEIATSLREPVRDVTSAVLALYGRGVLKCKLRHHERTYLTPFRTIEYLTGEETGDGDVGARTVHDGYGEEPNYRNHHRFKFRQLDDNYPDQRPPTLTELLAALRERFRQRTALAA